MLFSGFCRGLFWAALSSACVFASRPAEARQPQTALHPCGQTGAPGGGRTPVIYPQPIPLSHPSYYLCGSDVSLATGNSSDCALEPYASPLSYVGRFFDQGMGGAAREFGTGFPYRNGLNALFSVSALPVPELDRIYLLEGAVLGSFGLTDFADLKLEEKLTPRLAEASYSFSCTTFGNASVPSSSYLNWDSYDDPEAYCGSDGRCASGWRLGFSHAHSIAPARMGYDLDSERGLIFRIYGLNPGQGYELGILQDTGSGQFKLIRQINDPQWEKLDALLPLIPKQGSAPPEIQQKLSDLWSETLDVHSVFSIRSGDRYFVLLGLGNYSETRVYDVTDPRRPFLVTSLDNSKDVSEGATSFQSPSAVPAVLTRPNAAKIPTSNGHIAAILSAGWQSKQIHLFTAEELTRSSSGPRTAKPAKTFSADAGYSFLSVTTDGSRFYALMSKPLSFSGDSVVSTPHSKIVTFEARQAGDASSFERAASDFDLTGSFGWSSNTNGPYSIRYQSGYFSVLAVNYPGLVPTCSQVSQCGSLQNYPQVRIYKQWNGSLNEIPTQDFFTKFYGRVFGTGAPHGFERLAPLPGPQGLSDIMPFRSSGRDYLAVSSYGTGDVYEIEPTRAIGSPTAPLCSPSPTPDPSLPPPTCDLSQVQNYNSGSFQFNCEPSSEIKTQCRIDDGAWLVCFSRSFDGTSVLGDSIGVHKLSVRSWLRSYSSWDQAGDASKRSEIVSRYFTYDKTPPVIAKCSFDCRTGTVRYEVSGVVGGTMKASLGPSGPATTYTDPFPALVQGLYPIAPWDGTSHVTIAKYSADPTQAPQLERNLEWTIGSSVFSIGAGGIVDSLSITGSMRPEQLAGPGRYRIVCRASDAAGNTTIPEASYDWFAPGGDTDGKYVCP